MSESAIDGDVEGDLAEPELLIKIRQALAAEKLPDPDEDAVEIISQAAQLGPEPGFNANEETSTSRLYLGIIAFGRMHARSGSAAVVASQLVTAINESDEERARLGSLQKKFVRRTPAQAVRVLGSKWFSSAVLDLLRSAANTDQSTLRALHLIRVVLQYHHSQWEEFWPSTQIRDQIIDFIQRNSERSIPPSSNSDSDPQSDLVKDFSTTKNDDVSSPRWLIPRSRNDDPWSGDIADQIGVDNEAKAFARIAAARGSDPPLSIGVFGDWGAGKSFFMRLVHQHVAAIANRNPAVAPEAVSGDLFHSNIVQIRFNAWHYSDTNLWAGLVEHVFAELDRWMTGRTNESEAKKLLDRLATSRQLTLEAADGLLERRREHFDAANRLREAEAVLEKTRVDAFAMPREIAEAVKNAFASELTDIESEVNRVAKTLGLDQLSNHPRELVAAVDRLSGQAARGRVLFESLLFRLGGSWWRMLSLAAVVVILPSAFVYLKELLHTQLDLAWVGQINSSVLAVAGAIVALTGAVSKATAHVLPALDRLSAVKARLDQAVEKRRKELAGEVATPREAVVAAGVAVDRARADLEAATGRLLREAQAFAAESGYQRLLRFIRERAGDGTYARHLGLVATVRKDFEQLAALMTRKVSTEDVPKARKQYEDAVRALVRRAGLDPDKLVPSIPEAGTDDGAANPGGDSVVTKSVRKGTGAQEAETEPANTSGTLLSEDEAKQLLETSQSAQDTKAAKIGQFDRIILYIDDLDRCEPEQVVAVLQAVHMLLFFPLFVVFVAVDARWLTKSLHRFYPDLFIEADHPQTTQRETTGVLGSRRTVDEDGGATPHDYLEKIFQIPYWVQPLGENASRNFMQSLLREETTETGSVASRESDSLPGDATDSGSSPRQAAAEAQHQETSKNDPILELVESGLSAASANKGIEKEPADTAATLKLDVDEQDYMKRIAPGTGGSPRRALRFVNVYRALRATATQEQLDALKGGGYRPLLSQLAIATGAPLLLDRWFDVLEQIPSGTSLHALVKALEAHSQFGEASGARRLAEWRCLRYVLLALAESAAKTKERADFGRAQEDAVEQLRTYARAARRYSFLN